MLNLCFCMIYVFSREEGWERQVSWRRFKIKTRYKISCYVSKLDCVQVIVFYFQTNASNIQVIVIYWSVDKLDWLSWIDQLVWIIIVELLEISFDYKYKVSDMYYLDCVQVIARCIQVIAVNIDCIWVIIRPISWLYSSKYWLYSSYCTCQLLSIN